MKIYSHLLIVVIINIAEDRNRCCIDHGLMMSWTMFFLCLVQLQDDARFRGVERCLAGRTLQFWCPVRKLAISETPISFTRPNFDICNCNASCLVCPRLFQILPIPGSISCFWRRLVISSFSLIINYWVFWQRKQSFCSLTSSIFISSTTLPPHLHLWPFLIENNDFFFLDWL